MKYKPMFARCIVLTPVNHRKTNSGLLFRGNSHRGNMQDLRLACIVSCGSGVKEPLPEGTICIVQDGFEFIDTPIDIWEDCKHFPEYAHLVEYQRQTDCDIHTTLVFEHSLMAVWEGFKPSDRLSTGQIMAHLSD